MNRFKLILALWVALLGFCMFVSTNTCVNGIMLFLGFCMCIAACAYVFNDVTQKELTFIKNLERIIN